MTRVLITVMGFRCDRCEYEWLPRDREPDADPATCPKCKSPYWNRPRGRMSFENFRDSIHDALLGSGEMTWTEVRTRAGLPQLFPNNQWVRRLEKDIGLKRRRDKGSIIRWSIDSKVRKKA
jgi:hypothetical protein